MKRLFLLFAVSSIAMTAGAQERQPIQFSNPQMPADRELNVTALHQEYVKNFLAKEKAGAAKTTAGMDRWYNYGVYMEQKTKFDRDAGTGAQYVFGWSMPMWNDTFGIIGYTSGPAYLNRPSVANIMQPQFYGFNRVDLFTSSPTPMKVGNSDAYVVDSIAVIGSYLYGSNSSSTDVDTLRLALLYGDGSASSNIFGGYSITSSHYGTVNFNDIGYDSTKNRGAAITASSVPGQYMDILLTNSDTSSNNLYAKVHAVKNSSGTPTPLAVPAGNMVACAISYKSGHPGIFSSLPGDTVIGAVTPSTRYNMFRPVVNYYTLTDPSTVTTTIPDADWVPLDLPNDQNAGLFKKLPNYEKGWYNTYVPMWAWTTSGGSMASVLQFPEVAYHITCATCGAIPLSVSNIATVNEIDAMPNPASNVVNIGFSLTQMSEVTISLTNMLGQQVASKTITGLARGTATFNTSALPAGYYSYSVSVNGDLKTGKLVVAH